MQRSALLLVVLPLAIGTLAGCKARRHDQQTSSSSVKTSEPTATGRDFSEARDRLVRQVQTKLAQLDTKLASLKRDADARSTELTSDGKAALANAIAKLEQQRASAERALEQAKASTAEGWSQVKQRTDEALKNVNDAYQAAVRELRE